MNRYLSVWAGSRFLYTGVTQASFQIWGKDDDLRRRLNKQCKGITKIEAELTFGYSFCSSVLVDLGLFSAS